MLYVFMMHLMGISGMYVIINNQMKPKQIRVPVFCYDETGHWFEFHSVDADMTQEELDVFQERNLTGKGLRPKWSYRESILLPLKKT